MCTESYNYLIKLSFLGTKYHGTQIQNNAVTVQELLQKALHGVLGYLPDIKCCSRLDSGVHAKAFYVSFFTKSQYSPDRLMMAINSGLPEDIRVIEARPVRSDFHARYSAHKKKYEYLIWNSRVMDPFLNDRAYQIYPQLDEKQMDCCGSLMLGTHDFSAFCGAASDVEDKVRTVTQCSCIREGELLRLSFCADGFLYNMVRIMAGAMVQYSLGKLNNDDIIAFLNGKPRDNRLITLPAWGLYLTEVDYEFEG